MKGAGKLSVRESEALRRREKSLGPDLHTGVAT